MKSIEEIRALTRAAIQQQRETVQRKKGEEQDELRARFRVQRESVEQAIRKAAMAGKSYYELYTSDRNALSYLSRHFGEEGYEIEIDETSNGGDVLRLKW